MGDSKKTAPSKAGKRAKPTYERFSSNALRHKATRKARIARRLARRAALRKSGELHNRKLTRRAAENVQKRVSRQQAPEVNMPSLVVDLAAHASQLRRVLARKARNKAKGRPEREW